MDDTTHQDASSDKPTPQKRPWRAPQFMVTPPVNEVTASSVFGTNDGGFVSNYS